jgi:hypothetical protein
MAGRTTGLRGGASRVEAATAVGWAREVGEARLPIPSLHRSMAEYSLH